MLSRIAKLSLVATSFAPVLLTYAFAHYQRVGADSHTVTLVVVAGLLVFLCLLLVRAAKHSLEMIRFPVSSVKTADVEIVGFVLAYMLPLVNAQSDTVDPVVLMFVLLIFVVLIWTTNSYHVNPLLGLFGYHFYEVTTTGNITFLLITRKDIRSTSSVGSVVQLTDYMVLDHGR